MKPKELKTPLKALWNNQELKGFKKFLGNQKISKQLQNL